MGAKGKAQNGADKAKWGSSEIAGQEQGLWFSNVLCGVIRGCLEMVIAIPYTIFESRLIKHSLPLIL